MFFCYLFCILFSFLIFTYPLGNDCLPAGRAFVSLHGLVLHRSMYFVVIIDHRSIVIGQFVSHSHKRTDCFLSLSLFLSARLHLRPTATATAAPASLLGQPAPAAPASLASADAPAPTGSLDDDPASTSLDLAPDTAPRLHGVLELSKLNISSTLPRILT